MKRLLTMTFGAGLMVLGQGSAHAAGILFDFNALANNANNAAVQAHMNTLLPGAPAVTVTGATATKTYNGEGHVIGQQVGNSVKSVTLGTGDGVGGPQHWNNLDTFLYTLGSTQIQMDFTGIAISNISFDFQIFPDVHCLSSTNCWSLPDFSFRTSTNNWATNTLWAHEFGVFPVDPNDRSPLSNNEKTAQLGPKTLSFTFGTPVTGLRFIDWPPTIGIDNVCINCDTTTQEVPTPEPISMMLLGSGLLAVRRRFSKR
jgi:hypothetical protein